MTIELDAVGRVDVWEDEGSEGVAGRRAGTVRQREDPDERNQIWASLQGVDETRDSSIFPQVDERVEEGSRNHLRVLRAADVRTFDKAALRPRNKC